MAIESSRRRAAMVNTKAGGSSRVERSKPGKHEEALVREIHEELDTEIRVGELIDTIEYDYPTFHLSMDCFWAEVVTGRLVLKEAADARWLTRKTLESVQWLPADRTIIDAIYRELY